MLWVEGHHAGGGLWVEVGGPRALLGRELGGAVEETLLEDSAAASARHPPLVLGAAVGTVALEEERRHLESKYIRGRKKAQVLTFVENCGAIRRLRLASHSFSQDERLIE